MSIDHKAWLFDHPKFEAEVAPALYRALSENSLAPLQDARLIQGEFADVQAAGEAAIGPMIFVADEYGLSYGFDALKAGLLAFPTVAPHAEEMICGREFGPPERRFDPGLMGTGFISGERALVFSELLARIGDPTFPEPSSGWYADCLYPPASSGDLLQAFSTLRSGLKAAGQRGLGIMVVDFCE